MEFIKAYTRMGYRTVGECFMFENDYFAMEKLFCD